MVDNDKTEPAPQLPAPSSGGRRTMTDKPNPGDIIAALAELFPKCFAVYQAQRKPLKVAIHHDLLATGAITVKECATALRVYTANALYLKSCKVGAVRIDLDGNAVGHVTAEEAKHARALLDRQMAKWRRRQEAEAKAKAAAERKARNAGRISLADLRRAAAARRESAAA